MDDSLNPKEPQGQLESIQNILFSQERERIQILEERAESFHQEALRQLESLQKQSQDLSAELQQAQAEIGEQVDSLHQAQNDLDRLVDRLTPTIGGMIRQSIHDSRDEMAEVLGPVMGEAIRVQIRNSRQDMIDALYPIIGGTVQKSLAEFARELQQNIDARLKSTFSFRDTIKLFTARLRGVSSSQLTLRQALPFSIKELFLVHRESGLLMAHSHPEQAEASDADLVSSMLTAIRDFVRDSYGKGDQSEELDEIQYGNQSIVLVTGTAAYLAVVINGIEPEGFRAQLREFLSELHVRHGKALRDYNGNPAQIPNLVPELQSVGQSNSTPPASRPLTGFQKGILAAVIFGSIACLAFSIFYLRFTIALLPVAFPPTVTLTTPPTSTPTLSPTPLPSATPSPTFTLTPTPTPTLTPSPSPSFTPQIDFVYARGSVWVRSQPDDSLPPFTAVTSEIPLQVLDQKDGWVLITWQQSDGQVISGWIPGVWLESNP